MTTTRCDAMIIVSMIFQPIFFFFHSDEIADTSRALRGTRELCECSNLIALFRHIPRCQSSCDSQPPSATASATPKLFTSKFNILWLDFHTASRLLCRNAIESAFTNVSRHAAALRKVPLSNTRRNVQQHGASDVGIGQQSLWSSVDATLR